MASQSHVPDRWRIVRLGDVADVTFSSVDKKTLDDELPVELCNYTDVFYNRQIQPGMDLMVATATPTEREKWTLRKGDVLFTKDSETRDEIGIPAYVPEDMPNVLCGYHLGRARPDSRVVDGSFLARALGSPASARELARVANGITRFGLTLDATRSLPVLLPPLSEQRAIAAVLGSIDETLERTEEVIAAKEQLRDSLLQELLRHGVPGWHKEWKEVRGLGTVPACWDVVRLGDVTEVNPRRPPLKVEPMNSVTFVPMMAVAENCGGIVAPELRPFREVARGYTYFQRQDVLFAKITPCLQNGKHALAANLSGEFGFGTTEFHVIRVGSSMDPRHLFRVLTQPSNLERCQKSFSGTAGQQRVHPDVLRELRLCQPSLDEQRAIAGLMDGVDMAIAKERQVRERLQSLKDSTADVLLTGRMQIQKEGTTASV